ncbi:MAG: nucleotidyltransferase family protein [Alphaproteobacteria bacterium]|nr:nucleotidyltransferase family protein [Alphaproteobacteria bacterium]
MSKSYSKNIPSIQTAMILAAGYATRLRPISNHTPKAMVQIMGKPILGHILERLKEISLKQIIVNTHHLGTVVKTYLEQQPKHFNIQISEEKTILETGGGVKQALPMIGTQPFYVINGKIIWFNGGQNSLLNLASHWNNKTMDVLLLLQPVTKTVGYQGSGDFHLNADGSLKRRQDDEIAPFVFSGIQIIHPRLFQDSPDGSFSLNVLYDRAIAQGRLFGVRHDGTWLHISSPQDILAVEAYLSQHHTNLTRN